MSNKRWPKETEDRSYNIIRDVMLGSFMQGKGCYLVNVDGRRGYITIDDAMAYKYKVRDVKTDDVFESYPDLLPMIEDGWKVD